MRVGGLAALLAIVAVGVVVAGIAVAFFAIALPVALVAGLVAFGSGFVVLAGLAGVGAALLPARRAARLDVLRAITSE